MSQSILSRHMKLSVGKPYIFLRKAFSHLDTGTFQSMLSLRQYIVSFCVRQMRTSLAGEFRILMGKVYCRLPGRVRATGDFGWFLVD